MNRHLIFKLDEDEAQRQEKRRVAPPLEENVYYISLAEIQKRKVRVSDLPAFVTDKTMAYYEEEFDVSYQLGNLYCIIYNQLVKKLSDV